MGTKKIVLIFKRKAEGCGTYRETKLLGHAVKIAERVLERRI